MSLETQIKAIFEADHVNVYPSNNQYYTIEITASDTLSVTFDQLSQLSVMLNTKNINLNSRYESGGCDTCDHGAKTTCTLHVWFDTPENVLNYTWAEQQANEARRRDLAAQRANYKPPLTKKERKALIKANAGRKPNAGSFSQAALNADKCYNCGTLEDVLLSENPYAAEIDGDHELHYICKDCVHNMAMDI